MSTRVDETENRVVGLYHKLRRSFQGIEMIEPIEYTNLGSSLWRRSSGKMRYLKVALAVTRDRLTDIVSPIANEMYGGVGKIIKVLEDTYTDQYVNESRPGGQDVKRTLLKRLYEPLSIYKKVFHIDTLANYYSYREPRDTELVIQDESIKLFEDHRKMYCGAWDEIAKMDDGELVQFLEPNVNIGADLWISQNKKNFRKHYDDFNTRWLGGEYDLTLDGVTSMIEDLERNKIYPPITAFYRGKNKDEVRGVFGGSIPLKAMGACFQALKMIGKDYPKMAPGAMLPWGPWEDWSIYFPKAAAMVDNARNNGWNVIGEDFTKYDQHIRPEDIEHLIRPISDKVSIFYNYVLDTLANNKVYFGPYSISGIYYISGHPFTTELGSGLHEAIARYYANTYGAGIKDGSVNSDDNIIAWEDMDFRRYAQMCKDIGYPVKEQGSTNLEVDGSIRFLQVDVGPVRKEDDKSTFIGALDSRYPKFIHFETGGETMLWTVTENLEVDRILSKLGSFGEYGSEYAECILDIVRDNEYGKKAIRAIADIDMLEHRIESQRRDLVGFHPSWLRKVVLPDIRLHDL